MWRSICGIGNCRLWKSFWGNEFGCNGGGIGINSSAGECGMSGRGEAKKYDLLFADNLYLIMRKLSKYRQLIAKNIFFKKEQFMRIFCTEFGFFFFKSIIPNDIHVHSNKEYHYLTIFNLLKNIKFAENICRKLTIFCGHNLANSDFSKIHILRLSLKPNQTYKSFLKVSPQHFVMTRLYGFKKVYFRYENFL
jgi:hypothetical protein